jgi:hypothetical protein
MRITLNVDDDVLMAAKAIAREQRIPVGQVLSNLARQALAHAPETSTRNGVLLFPRRAAGVVVTPELVKRLLDGAP